MAASLSFDATWQVVIKRWVAELAFERGASVGHRSRVLRWICSPQFDGTVCQAAVKRKPNLPGRPAAKLIRPLHETQPSGGISCGDDLQLPASIWPFAGRTGSRNSRCVAFATGEVYTSRTHHTKVSVDTIVQCFTPLTSGLIAIVRDVRWIGLRKTFFVTKSR
jgi:hypothetical protein